MGKRAAGYGQPGLLPPANRRTSYRDSLTLDQTEPVPSLYLPIRRIESEARSESRCRDSTALELGCRRGVHRFGFRTYRPLQRVSGLAEKRVGGSGHQPGRSESCARYAMEF